MVRTVAVYIAWFITASQALVALQL